jgi:hypothetical protein
MLLFYLQADDMDRTVDPDAVDPIVDILTSLEELDAADTDDSSSRSSRANSGQSASSSSSSTSSSNVSNGSSSSSSGAAGRSGPKRTGSARGRSALRKYIEGFDQTTMVETARVVSAEGAGLVERQTTALFGDIKALTKQMQVSLVCLHGIAAEA